jgi:Flp pilus assembly protein TadG
MGRLRARWATDQSGQGLVEVALIIPVFLLVLVAIFDVGRVVYTNSTLSQAAREGARLAAAEAGWIGITDAGCVTSASAITSSNPGAHVCPATVADMRSHVVSAVNRMAVSLGPLNAVYVSCNAGSGGDLAPSGAWTETSGGNGCDDDAGTSLAASGELVSVRVELTYQPMTPIISSIIGSVPLSGSATMIVN